MVEREKVEEGEEEEEEEVVETGEDMIIDTLLLECMNIVVPTSPTGMMPTQPFITCTNLSSHFD